MSNAKPEAAAGKSSKGLLFAIVGLVVGLGGGGGAYYVYATKYAPKPAASAKHEPEPPPPTHIVAMEPFVVNLADQGASRYLRVNLSLVVEGEDAAKEGGEGEGGGGGAEEVEKARLRSTILETLSQQTSDHLVTPDGKAELKKTIAEKAHEAAEQLKVKDVLFSEFVVQF
jgi:flagellar FliL protein